jgi:hypothetical protein
VSSPNLWQKTLWCTLFWSGCQFVGLMATVDRRPGNHPAVINLLLSWYVPLVARCNWYETAPSVRAVHPLWVGGVEWWDPCTGAWHGRHTMHGSMARWTHHDALFFTNARYAGFAEREDRVSSYYLTLRLGWLSLSLSLSFSHTLPVMSHASLA